MDLTKLRKLEAPEPSRAARPLTGVVAAIVKVRSPRYRPPGVTVRSTISETLFTAEFPVETLLQLENDPEIESISVSRKLQLQSE